MTNIQTDKNLAAESFLVTRQQKEALNRQKAFVIWLTGLSCSGKSTIARYLEVALFKNGIRTLILDGDNSFVEVFVDAPLEVCIKRDTKGLYQKTINGDLKDFTGISSPYENPLQPQLTILTANQIPDEAVNQIINYISSENLISPDS